MTKQPKPMKNTCSILVFALFLFSGNYCYGQKNKNNPESPTNIELIQEAIEKNYPFKVIYKDAGYQLNKPFFDIIYEQVYGQISSPFDTLPAGTSYIELTLTPDVNFKEGAIEVYLDQLSKVEIKEWFVVAPKINYQTPVDTVSTSEPSVVSNKSKVSIFEILSTDTIEIRCDRIILNSGTELFVKIEGMNDEIVRYTMCLEEGDASYERNLSSVEKVLLVKIVGHVTPQEKIQPTEKIQPVQIIQPVQVVPIDKNKTVYLHSSDNLKCDFILTLTTEEKMDISIVKQTIDSLFFVKCGDLPNQIQVVNSNEIKTLQIVNSEESPEQHITTNQMVFKDVMTLKSGTTMKVQIIRVDRTEIVYMKEGDVLNRKFQKPIKFVSKITYADGYVQVF